MPTVLYYIRLLFLLIDGSTPRGIRNRTWFAVTVAVIAILADTICVYFLYDQLPHYIPAAFDWDYNIVSWDDKVSFWGYEIERVILLFLLSGIGCFITWRHPHSLIAKRTRCLLLETAMLTITTGIGISMTELFMEAHNATATDIQSYEISDYWEYTIMLLWFALSLAEYIYDYAKLRKHANDFTM